MGFLDLLTDMETCVEFKNYEYYKLSESFNHIHQSIHPLTIPAGPCKTVSSSL